MSRARASLLAVVGLLLVVLPPYGGANAWYASLGTSYTKVRTYPIVFAESETDINDAGEQIVWEAAAAAEVMSSNLILIEADRCQAPLNDCLAARRGAAVATAVSAAVSGRRVRIERRNVTGVASFVTIIVVGGRAS